MKTKFVRPSVVRKYLKEKERRVSPSFLYALDAFIQSKLDQAAKVHNGGKKTLDSEVAAFVGIKA
jgi:hypothetical protein